MANDVEVINKNNKRTMKGKFYTKVKAFTPVGCKEKS